MKSDENQKAGTKGAQMPNMTIQEMTYMAHDLDWFAFENRIRTTVHQLIDPIANK